MTAKLSTSATIFSTWAANVNNIIEGSFEWADYMLYKGKKVRKDWWRPGKYITRSSNGCVRNASNLPDLFRPDPPGIWSVVP